MGQQQLLLLVLGIVIVGLAVVVGIQAFSENSKKANMDNLVLEAMDIATSAQTWMLKPSIYGGGNNSCLTTCDWSSVTFTNLGLNATSGVYSTLNGEVELDGSAGTELVVTATNTSNNNQVVITVSGTNPTDVVAVVDSNYSS